MLESYMVREALERHPSPDPFDTSLVQAVAGSIVLDDMILKDALLNKLLERLIRKVNFDSSMEVVREYDVTSD